MEAEMSEKKEMMDQAKNEAKNKDDPIESFVRTVSQEISERAEDSEETIERRHRLLKAAMKGDVKTLQELLDAGAAEDTGITVAVGDEASPLIVAINYGHAECVRALTPVIFKLKARKGGTPTQELLCALASKNRAVVAAMLPSFDISPERSWTSQVLDFARTNGVADAFAEEWARRERLALQASVSAGASEESAEPGAKEAISAAAGEGSKEGVENSPERAARGGKQSKRPLSL
jgi:hypothetical protein